MTLYRKSFVVTLNAAVPLVVVETPLPDSVQRWEVEAFTALTTNSKQALIAEGNFTTQDVAAKIATGGFWDVLMAVPACPGGRVPCGNPQVLTFFSDIAFAVNFAINVIIREVPSCP